TAHSESAHQRWRPEGDQGRDGCRGGALRRRPRRVGGHPVRSPADPPGGALLATAMSELQLLEPRSSSDLDRLQRLGWTSLLVLAGFLVSSAASSALVR